MLTSVKETHVLEVVKTTKVPSNVIVQEGCPWRLMENHVSVSSLLYVCFNRKHFVSAFCSYYIAISIQISIKKHAYKCYND